MFQTNKKRAFIECLFLIFQYLFIFTLSNLAHAEIKYSYAIGEPTTSTVTETSFHQHFFGVTKLFRDEISQFRIPVVLLPEWKQPYITAYTAEVNNVMKLGFWGGLARIPGMNNDAVALITCHEVGHLIGGAPYIQIQLPQYADLSSEGQADYFATNVCLKKYFASLNDTKFYLGRSLPTHVQYPCQALPAQSFKKAICLRTMNAIEGFRHALLLMKPKLGPIDYRHNDQHQVNTTNFNNYPTTNQCRFDTFIAGFNEEPRPACWFKSEHP